MATHDQSLLQRLQVHNAVVHRVRRFLQTEGYVEVPVPELTPATGSCEVVDSMFSLDYFGALAFPRQTGQLYLEEIVARGVDAVYCEGESLRKEWKIDGRHLTEFKLIEIERRDMTLAQLCDFQEELVKHAAAGLSGELIGTDNVARLERMRRADHPRLTYREAIAALDRRGFALRFGDDLECEAEAALTEYCGGLPVHVTHYPADLKFFNMKLERSDPAVVECVDYILPQAGETFGGSLREPDAAILESRLRTGTMYGHLMTRAREFAHVRAATARGGDVPEVVGCADDAALARRYQDAIEAAFAAYIEIFREQHVERAGFGLGVARLLQYFLGLDSIKEAVIFPMDRGRFGGLGAATATPATVSEAAAA